MLPHLRTHRYQRAGPRGRCLPALILGLAAVAVHICLTPLNFVSGSLACRRSTPRVGSAAGNRRGRTALASRGGESAETLEVGDKVVATSAEDEQRYPGTIDSANTDGTFTVRWDDPDGGPETEDIAPGNMKKVVIFKDYVVGDDVEAVSPDDDQWYPGTVTQAAGDGTFTVKWDNPDGGPETSTVKPDGMKKVTIFKDYKVNDVVDAVFPDDGGMYPATVVKVNGDGTFLVKWEDADGGPEESVLGYKDMKFPPIAVEKLEVGQKYIGQVRSVMGFGAFVDIGAEADGLLHISRISKERVENVEDVLEEGQEVEVWISGKRDDGKFGVTMVEGLVDGVKRGPADLGAFADVAPDTWLTGRVAATKPFGAFVSVTLPDGGPTADGLVHISEIKDDGFVTNVDDEVQMGDEVQVRIKSVDLENGRMSLSMRSPFFSGGGGGGGGAREPADLSAFEAIPADTWLSGKVARTASFGAFVTVTTEDGATADGLVHITQIRDGFVESVEDELTAGQEVQVRVLSVDTGSGKMGLSMMQPQSF